MTHLIYIVASYGISALAIAVFGVYTGVQSRQAERAYLQLSGTGGERARPEEMEGRLPSQPDLRSPFENTRESEGAVIP